MRSPIPHLLASLAFITMFGGQAGAASAPGPLPAFTLQGKALEAKNLKFAPTGELERAALIKMEGRVPNPLGRYYFYYSPHKHAGIGLVYGDSITGPWKEYEGNPVIESTAIPDIRFMETTGKFHLWGHRKNAQTEMWTSKDGLHFDYHSVSVASKNIGTRNATYTRAYGYPLKRHGNRYIMLYSGFLLDRQIRCVWLAHSKDGENWTQETTPLVEPIEGENKDLYGPSLFQWEGRNYIVYQDHTGNRGGLVKYVELDQQLNPVGAGGKRFTLIEPDPDSPVGNRFRGCQFVREGDTIYMYAGGGSRPRILVHATAQTREATDKDLVLPVSRKDSFRPEFFVNRVGVEFGSPENDARKVKELGFHGQSQDWEFGAKLAKRVAEYRKLGLRVPSVYWKVNDTEKPLSREQMEPLADSDAVIEVSVWKIRENTIDAILKTADTAAELNVKLAIYPHKGHEIDTMASVMALADRLDHPNIGVMFVLCHFLRLEEIDTLEAVLKKAMPRLVAVSTSGGDIGSEEWPNLIQTLDKGSFPQKRLFRALKDLGYKGPVFLQCWGVKGDKEANLRNSMRAWHEIMESL